MTIEEDWEKYKNEEFKKFCEWIDEKPPSKMIKTPVGKDFLAGWLAGKLNQDD